MNKITFIHSLNNFSGSPNVLSAVVRGLTARGYKARVVTSRGEGFLSGIEGVEYRYTHYRWMGNGALTFMLLMLSQLEMFLRTLFGSRHRIYYINTIVPFGAILGCWLTRKRYLIHVHENMRQNKALYVILRNVYRLCNRRSIFVSGYLRSTAVGCRDGRVIYNSLPGEFIRTARNAAKAPANILMVSSLRRYKGVYEFAQLAGMMPQYEFELVLSADHAEVDAFAKEISKPNNLTLYPMQTDLHPFYRRSKLLLQLSHPESCVETFGLTILEAMAYGTPSIVPNVGGPAELVADGVSGYTVDPHDLRDIEGKITRLMSDEGLYRTFSQAALGRAEDFDQTAMLNAIEDYLK